MNISLVQNALHSFKKGYRSLENWKGNKNQMELKDAVLSFHHGIELLLKQLLIEENQFLVFKSIDNAIEEVERIQGGKAHDYKGIPDLLENGKVQKVQTVGFHHLIRRAAIILEIQELQKNTFLRDNLENLNDFRNRLVHFSIFAEEYELVDVLSELVKPFLEVLQPRIKAKDFENFYSSLLPQIDEVDEYINRSIKSLKFEQSEFVARLKQHSSYVDLTKTDFFKNRVFFKDGFVHTEYFAKKKMLEESARIFRDFPKIGTVEIFVPFSTEEKVFRIKLDLADFEKFFDVNIAHLRSDIGVWRKFLGNIKKDVVFSFFDRFGQY